MNRGKGEKGKRSLGKRLKREKGHSFRDLPHWAKGPANFLGVQMAAVSSFALSVVLTQLFNMTALFV